ncbi:MAG: alpha-glucosidase, partial [Clostridiales bacterium]|nr:alpha-glucosidase [Clostridiales bacterium]
MIDVKSFRKLIGESYIPPKWGLGYQQSRWGYASEEDFYAVAKGYESNHIPLEAIYMDIDYMERFKDFTIDREKLPHFETLVTDLKERGIKLVPIIDAGVKIEECYDIYEEGLANDYFCTDEEGKPFVVAVWPGRVLLPDFINPMTREWFGKKYQFLTDLGIEGFWNDMNEPAIFYSEEGLKEAFDVLDSLKDKNIGIYDYFALNDSVRTLSNSPKDYARIFHKVDGKKINHNKVHNLYGYNMTRAAAQGFDKIDENKRFLLFSRSSCVGMHRYGGIWTGDNCSWWSHLLLNIKMMPSLNMCGFLYSGADLGGFSVNTSYDLMVRWLQFGVFTPLMRNHSALGTREQELYQFKDVSYFRELIEFRYTLIPYLYSEYIKATKNNDMLFKPLSFVYEEDANVKEFLPKRIVSTGKAKNPKSMINLASSKGIETKVKDEVTLKAW